MPTIRDVAKLAGVAPITVSRVINNTGYISEETRVRVEAAIEELQYIPNTLSQSLRFKKTNTIGLVLSDISNPFWTTVTRGVEDACSQQGMHVFLCNTDEKQSKLDDYVDALIQRQTDGFLLVPAGKESTQTVERIKRAGVPLVVLDRSMQDVHVDVVRSDSEGGAYRLTEYLIQLGHRRIAIIPGPREIATSMLRLGGYKQALQDYGIPLDTQLIRHGQYNQEAGYNVALIKQFFSELNPKPTAIFAGNNFIAIGVVQGLYQMGVRIPEDVSIVSFDDVPYNWHAEPFMTVMAQSPYQLGFEAASLLLSFVLGTAQPDNRQVVLPVELLVRRSCRQV